MTDTANSAVVPEPEPAVEKHYRVKGTTRVLDHEPGARFRALLDPELETFLLENGHLEVLPAPVLGPPADVVAPPARRTTRTQKRGE